MKRSLEQKEYYISRIKNIKSEIAENSSKIITITDNIKAYETIELPIILNKLNQCNNKEIQIKESIIKYNSYTTKYTNFINYYNNKVKEIKVKLNSNKNKFEEIEDDINKSMYFIKYSNSLVRSFFNIINIKRIQIESINNNIVSFSGENNSNSNNVMNTNTSSNLFGNNSYFLR